MFTWSRNDSVIYEFEFMFELPVCLTNPMVLIESKIMFELPVGLANPMVLIKSKSMFELPVGLANHKVLIDSKSIFELPVSLANPMVLMDNKFIFELPVVLLTTWFSLIARVYLSYRWVLQTPWSRVYLSYRWVLETLRISLIENLFIGTRFIVRSALRVLRTPRVFLHAKIMSKLRYLMGVKNPNDIL